MDELLKNKKVNNFIYTTHNSKENPKENLKTKNSPNGNENVVK